MKLKLIKITMFALLFSMVVACEKEISKIENEASATSIAPYLEFPDINSYNRAINSIIENPDFVPSLVHDNPNFRTFDNIYDEFLDLINDENLSEEEYISLLVKYDDILTNENNVIMKRIEHPFANKLINRQGLVKVGEIYLLFTNIEQIEINSENITLDILNDASQTAATEYINRYRYKNDFKSSNACGADKIREVWHEGNNSAARLRKEILNIAELPASPSPGCSLANSRYFKTYVWTRSNGYRKSIWGNSWVEEKTGHKLDIKYTTKAFGGSPYVYTQYQHEDGTKRTTMTHMALVEEGLGCISQSANFDVYYLGIDSQSSTTGIGDVWVKMNCGILTGW